MEGMVGPSDSCRRGGDGMEVSHNGGSGLAMDRGGLFSTKQLLDIPLTTRT